MRLRRARLAAPAAAVVLLAALAGAGCSAVIAIEGIEPTDLSALRVGGTREAVESALGAPLRSLATEFGRIDTYEYDRGRRPGQPEDLGLLRCNDCEVGLLGVAAFYLVTQPYWISEIYETQKGEVDVYYGTDDIVVHVAFAERDDVANAEVIRNAACGDPDSQFDIGRGFEAGFSAIHLEPTAAQPAEALFWYTLAARRGHETARDAVTRLKPLLLDNVVSGAERRAAAWEPLTDCARPARLARAPT